MSIVSRVVKRIEKDGVLVTFYLGCTVLASRMKKQDRNVDKMYQRWIKENEKDIDKVEFLEYNPLISIVVPVYNVERTQLIECIESVKAQTYKNWELCLADDASSWKSVKKVLKEYESNPQIKVVYREKNGHISRATNSAIEIATGEYIAFMDCDDILTINALYEMVKKLNENPSYDFVYSDEDKVRENGTYRHMPHFKSDWAPDTLMSNMYTCHFGMYRKKIVDELGGLRAGYEGSQDHDFTIRFMEKTTKIGHVSKVLYHWRERAGSTAVTMESKPYVLEAARKAKEDALKRRGLEGKLELIEGTYQIRVNYIPKGNPLVSIIIPSKDNVNVYERCITTLFEKTKYKNFEVITIDNGSTQENKEKYTRIVGKYGILYHYENMEFNFSKMCNIGAQKAVGEYLLFLNDDIEIIEEEWLERMLGQAMVSYTGAVGAKLYYPHSKVIQHMGIVSLDGEPVHCLYGMNDESVYFLARNRMEFNYGAVTGACLMVNKEKFLEIGQYDEDFPVAYNDVDLCYKLYEQGYYNVVRNDVCLYHHESISRGSDVADKKKECRLNADRERLYKKHPNFKSSDPFFTNDMLWVMMVDGLGNLKVKQPVKKNDIRKYGILNIEIDDISALINIGKVGKLKLLKVEGWFYLKKYKHNNLNNVKVVFRSKDENTSYIFDLKKTYHEPGETFFKSKGNSKLTGFLGALDVSSLKSGQYQIYLKVKFGIVGKRYLVKTGKSIIV